MTVMTTVLLTATLAWYAFCNGVELVEMTKRRKDEGSTLKNVWNKEVEEDQSSRIGRILMKTFYFVPTLVSALGK